ncbi:MAG: hypothetical protein ABIF85_04070 [Nanoarchaeota archaeon]|nr:hypothetical protein [Nanoarchaeota archaeon]MBU4452283.1 hypothetical protein [Nanoarchaeota archaeon]MCG2724039.1 hypothetical protein [archaeon]
MTDTLKSIHAQKILDSRGNWTVEVLAESGSGLLGKGMAPSGASTGAHEAKVLDAQESVKIANTILQKLSGATLEQKNIDELLARIDGTRGFSRIGGNAAIAVSFAIYNLLHKEPAWKKKTVFPYPLGNVFGGGKHGGATDIQEFLLCPLKSKSFPDAIERMAGAYHELKKEAQKICAVGINDEGALTAKIPFEKSLDLICRIAGNNCCQLGLDVASSGMWNGKKYIYQKMKKSFDSGGQIDFISDTIRTYNLFYAEDPLHEEDFEGFAELNKKHGKKCLICGDDLTTTNPERIKMAMANKSVNSVIVKPNQVGTVTLAHEFVSIAKKNKIVPVISHRSAETTDSTISVIAFDWEIPIIKAGVVDMRVAKLNRLLEMWDNCKKPRMAKLK